MSDTEHLHLHVIAAGVAYSIAREHPQGKYWRPKQFDPEKYTTENWYILIAPGREAIATQVSNIAVIGSEVHDRCEKGNLAVTDVSVEFKPSQYSNVYRVTVYFHPLGE